ncbi:MAG: HD domain-containing phosphohydrolase [Planctomycetota bacterium]
MTQSDYIPISVATLMPTAVVGLDLFQQERDTEGVVLYRGSEYPLTLDDLSRLRGRGVHRLFISRGSRGQYQKYLRKIATSGSEASIPISARAGALNEVVRDVLQTNFRRGKVDQTVDAAEKLGTLAREIILNDEFAVSDLFAVLHHDYATFTHSTNVAFYCGMLASGLGYSRDEVQQIIAGGLLHDLGKLEIDEKILCKPGRLDDSEFSIIKTHPLVGFRNLATREDLTEGQLMMAYQHHERLDGRGYPVGCVENEIHPWAKICTVVDVFEALTSHRPYREPMSRRRALALQQRDVGTAFDQEIFECWTKIILSDSRG